MSSEPAPFRLVVATRLHLGRSTTPPNNLEDIASKFYSTCRLAADNRLQSSHVLALIAVQDTRSTTSNITASPSEEENTSYDFVKAVRDACIKVSESCHNLQKIQLHVIPIAPWGKFVPALNALIAFSCQTQPARTKEGKSHFTHIMFVSAELQLSTASIDALLDRTVADDSTLVVGARLAGHDYNPRGESAPVTVPLNGRTSPWNTLAVWNLPMLARTGFCLVSEGLSPSSTSEESYAGVEEVATIALQQHLHGEDKARAVLVQVPGVSWDVSFDGDPERQTWHARKMESKLTRAQTQLDILGLRGTVVHIVGVEEQN